MRCWETKEVIQCTGGTHFALRRVKGKRKTRHKDFGNLPFLGWLQLSWVCDCGEEKDSFYLKTTRVLLKIFSPYLTCSFLPFLGIFLLTSRTRGWVAGTFGYSSAEGILDFGGLWTDNLFLWSSVACLACCLGSAAIWGHHFQALWWLVLPCCLSKTETHCGGRYLILFLAFRDFTWKVCLWPTIWALDCLFLGMRRDGFETKLPEAESQFCALQPGSVPCCLSLLRNVVLLSLHPSLKPLSSETQSHLFLCSRDRK